MVRNYGIVSRHLEMHIAGSSNGKQSFLELRSHNG